MEKINGTQRVKNVDVLRKVNETRSFLNTIVKRKLKLDRKCTENNYLPHDVTLYRIIFEIL